MGAVQAHDFKWAGCLRRKLEGYRVPFGDLKFPREAFHIVIFDWLTGADQLQSASVSVEERLFLRRIDHGFRRERQALLFLLPGFYDLLPCVDVPAGTINGDAVTCGSADLNCRSIRLFLVST